LLLCARPAPDAAAFRAPAPAGIDWDLVLRLAERNALVPFLHRHLDLLRAIGMPDGAADRLRARHREGALRALRLAGELRRIVDRLAEAGIESLPYKGPTLAMQAYGSLSARSYVDLDLLVRPADAPRALRVLGETGYASVHRMTPRQDAFFRRVDGDYPLVHGETETLVELHCRPSSLRFGVRLETDALMRRARPVALGSGDVPAPHPEDLLLVLAVHGAKHRWKRLEWVAALAGVARRAELDLAAALVRAADLHARRALLLALALAHRLVGLELPDAVAREIEADGVVAELAKEAEARMFDAREEDDGDTAANLRYNLRVQDGAAARAAYAYRWLALPSPEDWAWRRLPDALFPLYRALRPARLLLRYAPRGGRR
ncbi:MAG TPA: nucleotidyltransferase family protein, partial [Longimicrobium sp.]|nr:nucleotidyltransferase family protein [Longimicrobium sp.]